ncbi:hypothetical protein BpHYR1_031324 [Brachionus plicatilis]|uniref:Uncharacterized protein n=1 Tax=Brachionus plicatilis TaxID=10195 RepID=A0A3M7QSB9_BRAPC|nr:hypothetical protein BpHYR1_031324 [Brachionus plicatilis]
MSFFDIIYIDCTFCPLSGQIEVHDQLKLYEFLSEDKKILNQYFEILQYKICFAILEESIKDLNQLNFDHLIMIMNFKLPLECSITPDETSNLQFIRFTFIIF